MAQLFAFRCCRFTFILTLTNERILKLMLNSTKRHNALVGSKFWFNKLLSHREVMTRLQNTQSVFLFIQVRGTVKQKVWNEAEKQRARLGRDAKNTVFFSRLVERVRFARCARARLLRHALPVSLLILRKKPTVLQSRSWHTYLFSVGFVSGRQDWPSDVN